MRRVWNAVLTKIVMRIVKKEIFFSISLILLFYLINNTLFYYIITSIDSIPKAQVLLLRSLLYLICIGISIFFLRRFNLLDIAGLSNRKLKNGWALLILIFLDFTFFSGSDIYQIPLNEMFSILLLIFFITNLIIGFFEEITFRGLIQGFLLKNNIGNKHGIILSVLIASLLFGLSHIINFFTGLQSIESALFQIYATTCVGVLYGAVLLKTNKLIPLAILHGLTNFFGGIPSFMVNNADAFLSEKEVSKNLPLTIFLTLVIMGGVLVAGVLLLKSIKPGELEEKLQ